MSGIVKLKASPEPGNTGDKWSDSDRGSTIPGPSSTASGKYRISRRTTTMNAGAGPSTATAARSVRHGRKPATNMTIELTDSESENAVKPPPKRARLAVKRTSLITPPLKGELLSAVGLRPSPSSWSSSVARVPQKGDKGKEKEGTVPLFMDSDDKGGQPADEDENVQLLTALEPPQSSQRGTEVAHAEADQATGDTDGGEKGETGNVSADHNKGTTVPGVPTASYEQEQEQRKEGDPGESESDEGVISRYVAQILEIVPDVSPVYLLALLVQLYPQHGVDTTNVAIQMLFEDAQYPKVDRKGKRKSEADIDDRAVKKVRIDYVDYSRQDRPWLGGRPYTELALEHLQRSFPYVPKPYIRKVLIQHNNLYAPAHIFFTDLFKRCRQPPKERPLPRTTRDGFPFFPRKTPYRPQLSMARLTDAEFDKERGWVEIYDEEDADLVKVRNRLDLKGGLDEEDPNPEGKGKEKATASEDEECLEGEGIECGCCFCEYPFEKMIQCPETHLFCKSCIVSYASNELGEHKTKLKCMHQDGCTHTFPESELRRALPQKLIDLYDRLKQQKEIEEADLEGLEECPFCEYKCVMEVDKTQEKLFRCGNADGGCGAISCRECKRPEHLPKSCKEMDEDKVLNKQHTVEEAMSAALMRNCPSCKKPFIKELGCNKITCTLCGTRSCYICRQIVHGYEHFNQGYANASSSSKTPEKCPLWDTVEARHAKEVKDAAEKAMADLKAENPEIDTSAIKVDVPNVPPPPAPPSGFRNTVPYVIHPPDPHLNNNNPRPDPRYAMLNPAPHDQPYQVPRQPQVAPVPAYQQYAFQMVPPLVQQAAVPVQPMLPPVFQFPLPQIGVAEAQGPAHVQPLVLNPQQLQPWGAHPPPAPAAPIGRQGGMDRNPNPVPVRYEPGRRPAAGRAQWR